MAYRSSTPAGSISGHGGTTAPAGYLICDGSAVSRTVYAALFASIGTAFGDGDGSTTFNVPDGRGYFMRGFDNGAGNDPDSGSRFAINGGNTGANQGSYQSHQYYSHTHTYGYNTNGGPVEGPLNAGQTRAGSFTTDANGGNETRPINFYANYIIKY